jgi:hypothetical protein
MQDPKQHLCHSLRVYARLHWLQRTSSAPSNCSYDRDVHVDVDAADKESRHMYWVQKSYTKTQQLANGG